MWAGCNTPRDRRVWTMVIIFHLPGSSHRQLFWWGINGFSLHLWAKLLSWEYYRVNWHMIYSETQIFSWINVFFFFNWQPFGGKKKNYFWRWKRESGATCAVAVRRSIWALDSQEFISSSCINRSVNDQAKALSPREFNIFLECSSKEKNIAPKLDNLL